MNDASDTASEIAWMKSLAAEGARSPVQGGSILLAAGLIWGTASVSHWVIASGLMPVDPAAYGVVWGIALLAFFAALTILIGRLKRQGGVETAANRAFGSVWSGLGWGIFALFAALLVLDFNRNGQVEMAPLSLVIPSIIMAFYGIGWAVTAAMLRQRGLWVLAISTFIAAPALAFMAGTTAQYLAYAAALYGLVALPGFLLMRAART